MRWHAMGNETQMATAPCISCLVLVLVYTSLVSCIRFDHHRDIPSFPLLVLQKFLGLGSKNLLAAENLFVKLQTANLPCENLRNREPWEFRRGCLGFGRGSGWIQHRFGTGLGRLPDVFETSS